MSQDRPRIVPRVPQDAKVEAPSVPIPIHSGATTTYGKQIERLVFSLAFDICLLHPTERKTLSIFYVLHGLLNILIRATKDEFSASQRPASIGGGLEATATLLKNQLNR